MAHEAFHGFKVSKFVTGLTGSPRTYMEVADTMQVCRSNMVAILLRKCIYTSQVHNCKINRISYNLVLAFITPFNRMNTYWLLLIQLTRRDGILRLAATGIEPGPLHT